MLDGDNPAPLRAGGLVAEELERSAPAPACVPLRARLLRLRASPAPLLRELPARSAIAVLLHGTGCFAGGQGQGRGECERPARERRAGARRGRREGVGGQEGANPLCLRGRLGLGGWEGGGALGRRVGSGRRCSVGGFLWSAKGLGPGGLHPAQVQGDVGPLVRFVLLVGHRGFRPEWARFGSPPALVCGAEGKDGGGCVDMEEAPPDACWSTGGRRSRGRARRRFEFLRKTQVMTI